MKASYPPRLYTHMPLAPKLLIGQFIVCRSPNVIPDGWVVRRLSVWHLGFQHQLPAVSIHDSASTQVGWLVGHAITGDGHLLSNVDKVNIASNRAASFESHLNSLGGRFAALCLTDSGPRFYLDPCGTLAAVFCQDQQIIASTCSLVPLTRTCVINQGLSHLVDSVGSETWYPFGLTPLAGVERLIPNHYLDMETWRAVRHWPKGEFDRIGDTDHAVRMVGRILERNIAAVAEKHPLHMPLTAGRDSRMLLACARQHVKGTAFFTVCRTTPQGKLDQDISKRISARFDLRHDLLPFETLSSPELAVWQYRTGGAVDGLDSRFVHSLERLDPNRVYLSGQAGDVERPCFWRSGEHEDTPISANGILQRMQWCFHGQASELIEMRAQQWLNGVPIQDSITVLDLLYIEQRLGCWAGPRDYGHVRTAALLYPFCHRDVLEVFLRLPIEYRRTSRFAGDLIRSRWPELLCFPFNWPVGWRRCVFSAERHLRAIRGGVSSLLRRSGA